MEKLTEVKLGEKRITKRDAVSLFKNQTELATVLGVTRGAVAHWPDQEPIPVIQEMKLRYLICPHRFKPLGLSPGELVKVIAEEC